jgi:hypothetical protein
MIRTHPLRTVSKKYCLLNSLHNNFLAVSQLHIPVVHLILNDREVIVMKCIRNCTFLFNFNTRSSTKQKIDYEGHTLPFTKKNSHDIMLILISVN